MPEVVQQESTEKAVVYGNMMLQTYHLGFIIPAHDF